MVGGRPQLASRQQGFAVVLQAAQKREVNKQISETEPAAICDVRCHWLSFRAGSSAPPADVFYLKPRIHKERTSTQPLDTNRAPSEAQNWHFHHSETPTCSPVTADHKSQLQLPGAAHASPTHQTAAGEDGPAPFLQWRRHQRLPGSLMSWMEKRHWQNILDLGRKSGFLAAALTKGLAKHKR